jgi:hypothetical protein
MAADTSTGTSTSGSSLPARKGSSSNQGRSGSQWALWFGLFGGIAAWTLHLAIAYPLVYNGCALGLDQLSTWLLILTAVLGAIALLATIAAFFTWRASAPTSRRGTRSGATTPPIATKLPSPDLVPALPTDPEQISSPGGMLGSRHLLGLMGMGLSGLSLLIMIFSAIAIVGLGPCYYR